MAGRFIWVEERLGSIPNPPKEKLYKYKSMTELVITELVIT